MQLIYRGISYSPNTRTIKPKENQKQLVYRGIKYCPATLASELASEFAQQTNELQLSYRGLTYRPLR